MSIKPVCWFEQFSQNRRGRHDIQPDDLQPNATQFNDTQRHSEKVTLSIVAHDAYAKWERFNTVDLHPKISCFMI
jgi:hypothetical protein